MRSEINIWRLLGFMFGIFLLFISGVAIGALSEGADVREGVTLIFLILGVALLVFSYIFAECKHIQKELKESKKPELKVIQGYFEKE